MRVRALGGVVGPAALVTTWTVLGARTKGYSPIEDPISRLAAAGSNTQATMTVGLLAFGVGIAAYSRELRDQFSPSAGTSALVCAVATVGIAATPLDSPVGGGPHAIAAGVAYASLAATPLFAAGPLAAGGRRTAAVVSSLTGVATAACLASSTFVESRTGLWQRAGFLIGDAWLIGSAIWLLTRNRRRDGRDGGR